MPAETSPLHEALQNGEFYMSLRLDQNEFACNDYEDPEDYVHETRGRITLSGYAGDELAEVGKFRVIQVDVNGLINQRESVTTAFDLAQETWDYYEALYDDAEFNARVLRTLELEGELVPSGLLILQDLVIYPEYRRRDFGLLAVKTLIQRFRIGVGVVAMTPFPDQHRGDFTQEQLDDMGLQMYRGSERAATLRLRAHFSQLGFRLIPETEVMALSPIRRLENVPLTSYGLDGS